jgi:hypothetical protein
MDLLCFPNAALLALPNDELLAVTRSTPPDQSLHSTRLSDGGRTWSMPVTVPG